MSLIDALIIIIVIICGIIGFKRGLIHSVASFVGTILVVILSFLLKNVVSIILYENLPFLNFSGFFKNVSVINILFYEVIAFLIVFTVLSIVLKLIIKVSKIIEKILKATIILGIPSKIGGLIVGMIEGYIISFVLLYVLSLSIFNIKELSNSTFRDTILNHTPVLSSVNKDSLVLLKDFEQLKKDYDGKSANEFNLESLDLFLKYKIVSVESVDKLIEKGKLKINNVNEVLDKYRVEEKNENID